MCLQLASANQQRAGLEQALNSERARAQAQIKELDQRLRAMQESMMARMQECNVARDMQVSLKTEIDAYQTLLSDADSRSHLQNIYHSKLTG